MSDDRSKGSGIGPPPQKGHQPGAYGQAPPADVRRYLKFGGIGLLVVWTLFFLLLNLNQPDAAFSVPPLTVTMKPMWLIVIGMAVGALLAIGGRWWLARRQARAAKPRAAS